MSTLVYEFNREKKRRNQKDICGSSFPQVFFKSEVFEENSIVNSVQVDDWRAN